MNGSTHPSVVCTWLRSHGQQTHCGLVRDMTGLTDPERCAVTSEVCQACQQWFPPTREQLNPVVASRLFQNCRDAIRHDGLAGFSQEQAVALQTLALEAIPHDFDSVPLSVQVDAQRNTRLPDVSRLIPRPRKRFGPRVREWGVAVTTAPRTQPTLARCLASLHAAGWNRPRIMVDGDVSVPPEWRHLEVSLRQPRLGAWPNYYLTLVELLMRQPSAEAYLVIQDDTVFFEHPDLRDYVESILWPEPDLGIVSLFCSRAYARPDWGWYRLREPLSWGALALIFDRETAIRLVSDSHVVRHRFSAGDAGLAHIDGLIGVWAHNTGTPVYLSSPSLSQHIGHTSSIWKDSQAFVNRRAAEFAGGVSLVPDRAPCVDEPSQGGTA
jgi:hypothetical protein